MKTRYLSLLVAAAGLTALAYADDEETTYTTTTFASFSSEDGGKTTSGNLQATTSVSGDVSSTTISTTDGSAIVSTDESAQVDASVTFVLNLSNFVEALNNKVVDFTSYAGNINKTTYYSAYMFLTMTYNSSNIGLGIDEEGVLCGFWQNTSGSDSTLYYYEGYKTDQTSSFTTVQLFVYDSETDTYSVNTSLSNLTYSGGEYYITVTYVQDKSESYKGTGATYYDEENVTLYHAASLASQGNTELTSITLDTSYITAAAVTTEAVDAETAGSIASDLTNTVLVPEPATATLSLLALAALAARRRRK